MLDHHVERDIPEFVRDRVTVDIVIENHELREDLRVVVNRDVPLLKGTARAIVDEEIESAEDFPDAARAFGTRVDELETTTTELKARLARLGDVGAEAGTKEAKFAAILEFAGNKHDGSAKVTVSPGEVRGCVDVSRRYAYELIDAMGEAAEGVRVREAREVETAGGTKRKRKALLVECEAVHDASAGVNEFTTGGEGHAGG